MSHFLRDKQDKFKTWVIALPFVLFIFACSLRFYGISEFSIQPDEAHWMLRSYEIVKRLKSGSIEIFTSHIGQPGITPALIMAAGEYISERLSRTLSLPPALSFYELVTSARISCLLIASAVVFPMFFIGRILFGSAISISAIIFLILLPHHIGLSRLAHLDAVMTFFVQLSILLFFLGVEKDIENNKGGIYKLFSGICWGFSIATKPTALALVPGFLLYQFVRKYIAKRFFPPLFGIGVMDIWAVLIGHVIFSLLYTRFWIHASDYLIRLKIKNSFADSLYYLGTSYFSNGLSVVLLFLFFGVVLLLIFFSKSERKFKSQNLLKSLLFWVLPLIFILFCLFKFPQVIENIIRFWTWSAGLSSRDHEAYGVIAPRPSYGYAGILFRQIPPVLLLAIIAGSIFSFFELLKRNLTGQIMSGFFLVSVIWIVVLSVSGKQTMRYIMPVVPALCFLASFGLYKTYSIFLSGRSHSLLFFLTPFSLLVSNFGLWPNNLLYISPLAGGSEMALESGKTRYLIGTSEAIDAVVELASKESCQSQVYVFGDMDAVKATHYKRHPGDISVKFNSPFAYMWGHLLIRYHQFDSLFRYKFPEGINDILPLYRYSWHGVPVISVYRVPDPDYFEGASINVTRLIRAQGRERRKHPSRLDDGTEREMPALLLTKGKEGRGFVFSGLQPRLKAGRYLISQWVQADESQSALDPGRPVYKLNFGQCEHPVLNRDISDEYFSKIEFSCTLESVRTVQITSYWFSSLNLILGDLEIKRIE
ncbi:MAG TPA: glycosyltransferase family 39 protein [Oligoflexia bacterium]|nr:glycosyltransferase family 39 protein [Oligoflexia bacterium]HMP47302.1 glycosyltransferase family 39 protein [Oligoflexia bacterium]